jgi:tRNA dimethylallyltransferase
MGPTASGKTALACELIQAFPFEIISVDSAMIYKELNIGTAKPDAQLLAQAPHHLIDILDPTESYSAASFCEDVALLTKSIINRGKIPLLVGGTMMYFHALQQGLSPLPPADEKIRAQLLHLAEDKGWDYMYQELLRVDAISATRIHPHDTQRIQRALEVYHLTQSPLSTLLAAAKHPSAYQFISLSLIPNDRAWLHERIALRFEHMLRDGLVDEVKYLLQKWPLTLEHPSMRSVGYRQTLLYLQGECDYANLQTMGVAATRQLAKRQLTWLRHWPNALEFSAQDEDTDKIKQVIRNTLTINDWSK